MQLRNREEFNIRTKFNSVMNSGAAARSIRRRDFIDVVFRYCINILAFLPIIFCSYMLIDICYKAYRASFYTSIFVQDAHRCNLTISCERKNTWIKAISPLDLEFRGISKTTKYKNAIYRLNDINHIRKQFRYSAFFNRNTSKPETAGISGSVLGSMCIIAICILIAVPLAMMTAIAMSEFIDNSRVKATITMIISYMISIPAVLYGMVGFILFVKILNVGLHPIIVCGATLACMMLPILVMHLYNAFRNIPDCIRIAAMSLGASRARIVLDFIIPISIKEILDGVLISMTRVFGEAAPLFFLLHISKGKFVMGDRMLSIQSYIWSTSGNLGLQELASISLFAMFPVIVALLILKAILDSWLSRSYYYSKQSRK